MECEEMTRGSLVQHSVSLTTKAFSIAPTNESETGPLCTTAYAVTLDGAIRMLYEMGYEGINRAIDVEYRRATMSGKLPSLVLTPPLMGQFRTGSATDSEIRNTLVKVKDMKDFKPGAGPQVRQSARMALREQVYADTTLDWAHIQNR
jgi:hypothetical protein